MFKVTGNWVAERFHFRDELSFNWIFCPLLPCGWTLPLSWALAIGWDLLFDWDLFWLGYLLCLGPFLGLGLLLCPGLAHGDGEELNSGSIDEEYMDSERVYRKDAAM